MLVEEDIFSARFLPAEVLGIQGSFRRPPLQAVGMFYAVSTEGVVYEFSPRRGAIAHEFARLEIAAAGYNRSALVNVGTSMDGLHGRLLLGCGPNGVEALPLASGKPEILYRPPAGRQLAANSSESDSTNFKGLAADDHACAFGLRKGPEEFALMLLSLNREKRTQEVLVLRGQEMAGPALYGRYSLLCTDRSLGCFDRDTEKATVVEFPATFSPLLRPSSTELTVGPGGLPLAAALGQARDTIWVAGLQGGRAGILQIELVSGQCEFVSISRGSSLSTAQDGSACLASGGDIVSLRANGVVKYSFSTRPGMPVSYRNPYLCSFADEAFAENHRLELRSGDRRRELKFTDAGYDGFSCCGVYVTSTGVLASRLDLSSDGNGMGLRFTYFPRSTPA